MPRIHDALLACPADSCRWGGTDEQASSAGASVTFPPFSLRLCKGGFILSPISGLRSPTFGCIGLPSPRAASSEAAETHKPPRGPGSSGLGVDVWARGCGFEPPSPPVQWAFANDDGAPRIPRTSQPPHLMPRTLRRARMGSSATPSPSLASHRLPFFVPPALMSLKFRHHPSPEPNQIAGRKDHHGWNELVNDLSRLYHQSLIPAKLD